VHGATQQVPFVITAAGPVREHGSSRRGPVRHQHAARRRRSGPGLPFRDAVTRQDAHSPPNLHYSFPKPTSFSVFLQPLFGLGLVDIRPTAALQANLAANATTKSNLGISCRFNTSGNDGTITRFGWKAQNKSFRSSQEKLQRRAGGHERGVRERALDGPRMRLQFHAGRSHELVNSDDGTTVERPEDVRDTVNFAYSCDLRHLRPRPPVSLRAERFGHYSTASAACNATRAI